MSAFVVSRTHLDALLSAADLWDVQLPITVPGEIIRNLTADETGNLLMAVNVAAVNHRYRENDTPDPYTFDRLGIAIQPGAILKAIDCYRYQACEHPQWRSDRDTMGLPAGEQSDPDVKRVQDWLEDLERAAIQRSPGYQDAPWEITDDRRSIFGAPVWRIA